MSVAKPGTNEVAGIGLGLISWILPDVPVVIKVIIGLAVMAVIIFLMLEKNQQQKTKAASAATFRKYIIPGLAGAMIYFFFALIALFFLSMITTMLFDKPGIFTHPLPPQADYRTGQAKVGSPVCSMLFPTSTHSVM